MIICRRWDLWQPGLAILDITNPAACKWYTDKLSALIDLGVDAFKVGLLGLHGALSDAYKYINPRLISANAFHTRRLDSTTDLTQSECTIPSLFSTTNWCLICSGRVWVKVKRSSLLALLRLVDKDSQ